MRNQSFNISGVASIVAVIALALLGPENPALAQDATADSQSDATQLARGAQTWADNCNRCHNMRDPKEFRDDQWRSIVSHMRVRGGLTGQEARDALVFLQASNNASASPSSMTLTSVSAAADDRSANVSDGQTIYAQTCIACHGADGKGAIPGVADFSTTDGPLSKSDAELLTNIGEGFQSPGSFMAMPAKGGNPNLTDADVRAVLAYLRTEFGSQ